MAKKIENGFFPPYYKGKSNQADNELALYLRHKFMPHVRRRFPQHFLAEPRPAKRLAYIRRYSRTHPYFLRFDVQAFYPSVDTAAVAPVLLPNYTCLTGKKPSGHMQQHVRFAYSRFFSRQPWPWGLPAGAGLCDRGCPEWAGTAACAAGPILCQEARYELCINRPVVHRRKYMGVAIAHLTD